MVIVNINEVSSNPEDFVLAKRDIEKDLIESKQIEEKMNLQEFINYIDLTKTIFVNNDNVIPFKLISTSNESYIIHAGGNQDDITKLDETLKNINYNLSKLHKRSNLDVLNGILSSKPYFIIDNDFYN